jgi:hypothetical protein
LKEGLLNRISYSIDATQMIVGLPESMKEFKGNLHFSRDLSLK